MEISSQYNSNARSTSTSFVILGTHKPFEHVPAFKIVTKCVCIWTTFSLCNKPKPKMLQGTPIIFYLSCICHATIIA